ncbi:hypothetical protein JCM13304A_05310 [Desulfothermus okinawensis JCM 13304]
MPNFIVSPCGTSLLTGRADNEVRSLISKYANCKYLEDIDDGDRKLLQKRIKEVKDLILSLSPKEVTRYSAELNAIVKFYNGLLQEDDYHFLLCTDTYLGEQTGNMIKEWLEANKVKNVQLYRQMDLQTNDIDAFQMALSEMVDMFERLIPAFKRRNFKIIFNLTGGFKSVQGFLQTIGMFYADEIIYIFESGSSLLRIPKLPVKIDTHGVIEQNITIFRLLELGEITYENVLNIPEIFWVKIDGEVGFSPWGKIAWLRAKDSLYEKRLWPEPNSKIKFSEKFKKQVAGLFPDKIKEINIRIDDLALALSGNEKILNRLSFKPIKGKPKEISNYEFYAFTGTDKRCYGHFEDEVFVIDELGSHL